MDKQINEPLEESSEEDENSGEKPEFLQFVSERKDFLHDFVQRKLSTAMTKSLTTAHQEDFS